MSRDATGERRLTSEGRRLGVGASLLVVLAAFVVGQLPLLYATTTTEHPDPPVIEDPIDATTMETWGRYDTWLYLDVARSGPSLIHCDPVYWPPEDWCGTSGWLPLFPALVWGVHETTGARLELAGAVIARLAHLGVLALIWFAVLGRRWSPSTAMALLMASTAAGVIWLVAIFPMSLAVLLAAGSLVLLARDRWALAGLLAGLAATAHTMGVIAVGVGGLCILADWGGLMSGARASWRATLARGAAFAAPAVGCYVLMLAWYQREVGEWAAPFMTQEKYGHGFQNPIDVLVGRVLDIRDAAPGTHHWQYVQTALVAFTVVAVLVRSVTAWRSLERIERYLVVAAVAFWVIPLSYGGELASYYRLETLTLPAAVLTWRLPPWIQAPLLVGFAVTSYHVAQGFYIGVLI